jgi:zinc protease
LYQKLVKEKEVAVGAFGGPQERRGPSLFGITISVRPGKDLKEIESLVYAELERFKSEPVANWELDKVHATNRRQQAQQLQSTLSRAILLSQYAVFYKEPGLLNTIEDKLAKVSKEDIQRVAKTYFKETSRTVITTVPKPKEMPQTQPAK